MKMTEKEWCSLIAKSVGCGLAVFMAFALASAVVAFFLEVLS